MLTDEFTPSVTVNEVCWSLTLAPKLGDINDFVSLEQRQYCGNKCRENDKEKSESNETVRFLYKSHALSLSS